MRSLSEEKRLSAIALLQNGCSTREVSRLLGICQSTCSRIQREYAPHVERLRGGRPKSITPAQRRACVRAITQGGLNTAVDVRNALSEQLNVVVSTNTVRRTLHEAGLGSLEKQKKPLLTAKNIRSRLEFAQRHKDWTVHDWNRVIFSDETKINRFQSDGRAWCWVRDEESHLQARHVSQTVKHGGGAIFVWGCMTSSGMGYMCKIEGKMKQDLYLRILQDELMDTIKLYHFNPFHVIFQHDNDPKHTAKLVKHWLSIQNFDVLIWPPQSLDINPIEHVWALVKQRLNEYLAPAKGMLELWERVQDSFNSITPMQCQRFYHSMPNRIQAVLASKGRWTNY